MIPSQQGAEGDRTQSGLDQSRAGGDQTHSDRDLAHGVDRDTYDSSREGRERTSETPRMTASERHDTASARDATATARDLSAVARDRAAEARDREDDGWDAQVAALRSPYGTKRRQAAGRSWMRAARDRRRASSDRTRSAVHRVDAGTDRVRAASDRELAAEDRALAAQDRVLAAEEREADEVDVLTGARRRAPGLADVQRQIDRANRCNGRLIAAYVDVDGLKAINDSKGHHAGDLMLKHIVGVLQTHLRTYEPVVRVGGDEFVCTISDTTIDSVRGRFERITAELSLSPDDGSITVGFAQLAQGDSPMDLIDRADSELIAARDLQRRDRRAST